MNKMSKTPINRILSLSNKITGVRYHYLNIDEVNVKIIFNGEDEVLFSNIKPSKVEAVVKDYLKSEKI